MKLLTMARDLRRRRGRERQQLFVVEGIRAIEKYGHFEIHGDAEIMGPMDALLSSFVAQHRMKLAGKAYTPCYRVIQ